MTERERVSKRFCTHEKMGRIPGRKTFRTTEEKEEEKKYNEIQHTTPQIKSTQKATNDKPNRTKISEKLLVFFNFGKYNPINLNFYSRLFSKNQMNFLFCWTKHRDISYTNYRTQANTITTQKYMFFVHFSFFLSLSVCRCLVRLSFHSFVVRFVFAIHVCV